MISIHSPASRHHPLNDFAGSLLLAEIILAPGSGSVPSHIAGDRNLHRNYRKNRSARTFMPSSLSTALTVTLNSVALAFPSHTSTFLRNTPLARSLTLQQTEIRRDRSDYFKNGGENEICNQLV